MHHRISKPKRLRTKQAPRNSTKENAEDKNIETATDTNKDKNTQARSIDFSTIIANSIHDMKNSLALLLTKIDQLDDKNIDHSKTIAALKYEGGRVKSNLIHLLSIYRIDKKQYFVNVDEHNVYELFSEQLAGYEALLSERDINCDIDCDDQLNWFFDRELIEGVIANLINNAYRYANKKIRLSANVENKQLKICVKDDGPGYPEKMISQFSPANSRINYSTGSTGLGLYFAALIAELHTNKAQVGTIVLSNDGINAGGCFTLYLP